MVGIQTQAAVGKAEWLSRFALQFTIIIIILLLLYMLIKNKRLCVRTVGHRFKVVVGWLVFVQL